MSKNQHKQAFINDVFVVLFMFIIEYIIFHNVIGTNNLLGDTVDGRLIAHISEHWYQVFCGNETITEMHGIFYPAENVLAYSDLLLPVGAFSALLRLIGVTPFSAFKYVMIFFHLLGGIVFYFHVRYQHRINIIPGLLATMVFTFSGIIFTQNVQIISVTTLSIGLVFLYNLLNNKKRSYRIINGVLFALFWVLEACNAFYVAYMFALQLIIFFIVAILVLLIRDRDRLLTYLRRWYEYVIYMVVMGLLLIPFLKLYMPIFNSGGGRTWEEVFVSPVELLFYNGLNNYALKDPLSDVHTGYCLTSFPGAFPLLTSILLLLIVCVGIVLAIMKKTATKRLIIILAISTILILLFGISVGGNTLWKIIYMIVPGAKAIRATQRWIVVMLVPLSLIIGLCANVTYVLCEGKKKVAICVAYMLVVLLFSYENIYWPGFSSSWNDDDSKAYEEYVKAPPDDCRIFYIKNGDVYGGNTYVNNTSFMSRDDKIQMDAMAIATFYHLKTFNGYSGLKPKNWNIVSDVGADTDNQAKEWMRINGIEPDNVYAYDMIKNTWSKVSN